PSAVRSSARRRSSTVRSTNSRSQCGESFIVQGQRPTTNDQRRFLPKLLQKPHIPLEEQLQIVDAIYQHGHAVHAHAKREAGNLLRVVTVVVHELENVSVKHAAAKDFYPSRLLAGTARLLFCVSAALAACPAVEAGDKQLRTWLGER